MSAKEKGGEKERERARERGIYEVGRGWSDGGREREEQWVGHCTTVDFWHGKYNRVIRTDTLWR